MNIFEKIFGTHSDRELKRVEPIVKKIESYRSQIDAEKTKAAEKAAEVAAEGNPNGEVAPDDAQTGEAGEDSTNGDATDGGNAADDTTQTNGGE